VANFLGWSEEQIGSLLFGIWTGVINENTLPVDLNQSTFDRLMAGVIDGFGEVDFEEDFEVEIFAGYTKNIGAFSAAKTFQQVNDMRSKLVSDDGFLRTFPDFRSQASEIFDEYNDTWLRAEHATAINQAIGGAQWASIQNFKDTLELLQYRTVGDDRVRAEHRVLNGIVKPVDDPFWRENFPPNGWQCRCTASQHEEGEVEETGDLSKERIEAVESIPDLFKMNSGRDKLIFKSSHPYFKVDERFKVLKDNNFGLPIQS
jgi:SPP1 gp7 family putative phage head morphogenesis protein